MLEQSIHIKGRITSGSVGLLRHLLEIMYHYITSTACNTPLSMRHSRRCRLSIPNYQG